MRLACNTTRKVRDFLPSSTILLRRYESLRTLPILKEPRDLQAVERCIPIRIDELKSVRIGTQLGDSPIDEVVHVEHTRDRRSSFVNQRYVNAHWLAQPEPGIPGNAVTRSPLGRVITVYAFVNWPVARS